jgi:hypothetical protein
MKLQPALAEAAEYADDVIAAEQLQSRHENDSFYW